MHRSMCLIVLAVLTGWSGSLPAQTPKPGGVPRVFYRDSPGSASILEESTDSVTLPFMAVFKNLVLYKQDEPRNTIDTIIPELATSWA